EIPIWISDYVLISYGTGAVMAVPGGDQRDYEFADKFNLEIRQVITPDGNAIEPLEEAYPGQGIMLNSEEYNGLKSQEFFKQIVNRLEREGHGKATVNFKLRDWVFTRQRYWGEPIPVLHLPDGGIVSVPEEELPVVLPVVTSYEPSQDGESPLAKVPDWVNIDHPKYGSVKRETNTMPQWAGSCWYYLRYLDPNNKNSLADPELIEEWSPVDLYVGGAEHAVLHLLYARFWHKVLFDLGEVSANEPFQRLVNQGMIQGRSSFAYRIKDSNKFVSHNLKGDYETTPIHVNIELVNQDILDVEGFKKWQPDLADAEFILEDGKYICGSEVEKMSKSKLNVVTPDDIVDQYGADTLRLYEMFLGPVEQPKPWNTHGIEGVFKFLRKFWRLFHDLENNFAVSDATPSQEELKVAHQTIKKVAEDIERFSFNTAVSAMMICANELTSLKCNKRSILKDLVIVLSPFAPHMAEELWQLLGHQESITKVTYPEYNQSYLAEDSFEYPVSINGKMRTKMSFPSDLDRQEIETQVLASEIVQKWLDGKTPKKVIVVPKKIVNVVV
ncbi:MAG: leucine--tRNA ligase, partial [Cyclobacteriaceae bacterium]